MLHAPRHGVPVMMMMMMISYRGIYKGIYREIYRGIYMGTYEYAVVWLLYISVSANKIEAHI